MNVMNKDGVHYEGNWNFVCYSCNFNEWKL